MKDRIKKIRKSLDLTQQEFADRIGVKRNSYANYEIGRNIPIDAIILSICREFNVNETWLRTGEGEMFNKVKTMDIAHRHFDYLMENASYQKKAVLSALIEMMYSFPDDKWDYVFKQFEACLKDAKNDSKTTSASTLNIDAEVEEYRQCLELEREAEEKSSVSRKDA